MWKKNEGVEGVVFDAGYDFKVSCQVRNVLRDFSFSHILGMSLVAKEYESPDQLNPGLFCTNRVVLFADYFGGLVEKSHRGALPVFVVSRIAPNIGQHSGLNISMAFPQLGKV
jgi:hypothetical protein